MLGAIQFENFIGLTSMPQGAASAWSAVDNLLGAKYTPLIFVGTQIVNGVNYWFIAEQATIAKNPERHIVALAVNENCGQYAVVPGSITTLIA